MRRSQRMNAIHKGCDGFDGGTEASVSSCYSALEEGFRRILEVGSTASIPGVQTAASIPVYPGHESDISKLAELPNDCAYESLLQDALVDTDNCYQLSTIFTAVGAVIEFRG
ncbi:hypothetical protein PMIN06_001808 [Paraphaeosphaeria minitans]